MTAQQDLPRLPFPIPDLLDIAPQYRTLQAEQPITRVRTAVGDTAWLVTGYQEVKALFLDERLGRAHPDPDRAPRISDSVIGGPIGSFETEQQDHDRMRRLLEPSFSARRMESLRGRVVEQANGLLDRFATLDRPVDLHAELSVSLSVLVLCELLGVPMADYREFRDWSEAIVSFHDRERSAAAFGELIAYLQGVITEKRHTPAGDVISDLAAAEPDPGYVSLLAAVLLVAGHEATPARIDFGTVLLLLNPSQWDALRRDSALQPTAVEEVLRFASTGGGLRLRYARTDLQIGNAGIRAGDAVLLIPAVPNRDQEIFADADRFDIARRPNPHLSFGYGRHYCIGAGLARIELQVALSALATRFPGLRLAVRPDELKLRSTATAGGLTCLPVTW
jgi:pentalenolactone synthase